MQKEIEERADFLDQMTKLGRRKQYESIILTEISQVKFFFVKIKIENLVISFKKIV